jgi:hypothetical protein
MASPASAANSISCAAGHTRLVWFVMSHMPSIIMRPTGPLAPTASTNRASSSQTRGNRRRNESPTAASSAYEPRDEKCRGSRKPAHEHGLRSRAQWLDTGVVTFDRAKGEERKQRHAD